MVVEPDFGRTRAHRGIDSTFEHRRDPLDQPDRRRFLLGRVDRDRAQQVEDAPGERRHAKAPAPLALVGDALAPLGLGGLDLGLLRRHLRPLGLRLSLPREVAVGFLCHGARSLWARPPRGWHSRPGPIVVSSTMGAMEGSGFGDLFGDPDELQRRLADFAQQMQGQQRLAWADNAIKLAVDMTVAAVNRVNLQGNAEAQAEQIRAVIAVVFPEAVTLVREAREGLQ